jgi:PAS domain S-box-containing protein
MPRISGPHQPSPDPERSAREAIRTIVEAVTDGFVAVDADHRFTYVNRRAAELWGKPVAELVGHTPSEIWPEVPSSQSPLLQLLERVRATRRQQAVEAFSPTLERWIELRVYPAADGGLVAFFGDITDRRHARDADAVIAEASQLLASSTDYRETLANVARAAVPRLADWSAVDLLGEPGSDAWPPALQRVAMIHLDPAKLALGAELVAKYPEEWKETGVMTTVLRHGRSVFIPELTDEMLAGGARDAEHLRILRALEFRSVLVVPIVARERVLGALTLCMTESGRHNSESDLRVAEDLGRRAGMAIDTASLLRETRDAREAAEAAAARTARLQEVTAVLARALTEREVADALIEHGVPALGAVDGTLYLLSDDGEQLVHVASGGIPEATTQEFRVFAITADYPLSQAVRTGEPVVMRSRREVVERFPSLREANARATALSWLALPLRAGDRILGGIGLGFGDERDVSPGEIAFAETLARLCAQALLRARLYDEAQRARALAEEANAAKLSFLATMSHELRTPLNAIAGHVQLLEMGLLGPVTDSQREALERVNRAQAHLLGLINDVLTYAKVDSGRVEYAMRPVDAGALVRDVSRLVEPQFAEKLLALRVEGANGGAPLHVTADEEKLTQILLNLLSNALKYTPSPGAVTVTLAVDADDPRVARITVHDTGVGIPAAKLQSVFEPFVQLGRGLTSAHQGTGLGLSISRDLARGMGGELMATSAEHGATFVLTVPRSAG